MVYKVIGLMSGSSLDGLDIVYSHLQENAGKWTYEIVKSECYPYTPEWIKALTTATDLSAKEYQLLHASYGHFLGQQVNRFIEENNLHYQVQLIASHGHTTFHIPQKKMTSQLGDGAAIAAETSINVISDLRAMDIALGGQGAPIVPIGEKLLLGGYDFFLNLGGIANISASPYSSVDSKSFVAFDICPANRILNMLASKEGKSFDENGEMAAKGLVKPDLLETLNHFEYYSLPFPKSLANDFGTDQLYPAIQNAGYDVHDSLRTYVEHICTQVKNSVYQLITGSEILKEGYKLLATGGGAHNIFLAERLKKFLDPLHVELVIPEKTLIDYKEALIIGLIGVLRWREENNVLSSVTGATRNSIGGAVWIGQQI
ncbi:MAG TPA: anhydro-N-acetylmuramic acid kinase [Puia sp.]|nr:anhydro-N-acetylmuramic acid kinase [Puia sp.]